MTAVRIEIVAKDSPALGDAHVDAPLTLAPARKKKRKPAPVTTEMHVVKADTMQQIVYGIVLEPDTVDSQGDYESAGEIEKAAHRYLTKAVRGRATVHRIQHAAAGFSKDDGVGLVPVESFIAPCDFTYDDGGELIRKGSWVLAARVEDPQLWQDVLDGKFTGWSIGGTGVRRPA